MGKVAAFMVAKGAKVVAVNAASAYQARLMEATVYCNINIWYKLLHYV